MEKITICDQCIFFKITNIRYECEAPDAPITGFIFGAKDATMINVDGKCPYFKRKMR